jgi:hypothetical protein
MLAGKTPLRDSGCDDTTVRILGSRQDASRIALMCANVDTLRCLK